jgi:hypothetical protein
MDSTFTSDNLILSILPNCEEMLKRTLQNVNISYYPNSNTSNTFKVFDFAHQRAGMENEDDFVEIDQKQQSSQTGKTKSKITKKTQNVQTGGKKPQMTGKQQGVPQQSKFKVLQTIPIQPDWKTITDFNKQSLEKLRIDSEPEVEDRLLVGELHKVSDDYEKDRINPLNPVNLERFENFKFFGNLSTMEDEKMKNGTDIANVFVTDKILSVLMTCVFNSRPWHLNISKVGDSIFIDKMHNSDIDLITVNESAAINDIPTDDSDDKNIDSFKNLSIEATLINEFIKEQILDPEVKFDGMNEPHPFATQGEENADNNIERLAYRYRVWKLGDIEVLVRSQVHAFDYTDEGDTKFVNIYAMNEFDVSN